MKQTHKLKKRRSIKHCAYAKKTDKYTLSIILCMTILTFRRCCARPRVRALLRQQRGSQTWCSFSTLHIVCAVVYYHFFLFCFSFNGHKIYVSIRWPPFSHGHRPVHYYTLCSRQTIGGVQLFITCSQLKRPCIGIVAHTIKNMYICSKVLFDSPSLVVARLFFSHIGTENSSGTRYKTGRLIELT